MSGSSLAYVSSMVPKSESSALKLTFVSSADAVIAAAVVIIIIAESIAVIVLFAFVIFITSLAALFRFWVSPSLYI